MDILSIGNSFSEDAQRYLNRIAKADGVTLNTFNLYIGGCPLSRHHINMQSEQRAYILGMNGESTGFAVSLKEALLNRDWDVITLQQGSVKSPYYESYQPYLNKLADYIRDLVPQAKIAIHQTWAYEHDAPRLGVLGFSTHTEMFNDVKAAYQKAFEEINADILIPSGELLQSLIANGVEKVHRDCYHLSFGLGRYAVGLLWYSVLTGNSVKDNTFCDFDEEIPMQEIELAKKCVAQLCGI